METSSLEFMKTGDRSHISMTSWKSFLWVVVISGQILMYGTYSVLVNLSKVNGEVPFHTSSLVLITEVFKLIICLVLLAATQCKHNRDWFPSISLSSAVLYAVPAICYTLNNNLSIFMQSQMDPATYMVLGNLKILTTGLLYQVMMNKQLGYIKWFSLALLTLGGAMSSVTALNTQIRTVSEIHCTWLGLLTMTIYCTVSGFAGVFTEYQFKTSIVLSLLHQNILLYSFGIVFNLVLWVWQNLQHKKESSKTVQYFYLFDGYSAVVWLIVLTQSVVGLVMSTIVKYKSNMTRVFVISSAPVVTTIFSYIFFHLRLQPLFVIAGVCVVIATAVYNVDYSVTRDKLKRSVATNV